ncbi:MAG: AAA family ATPase [Desulfovibrio sp.]|jgi:AAA15 family ATPase/GTPase|nr:AAA family ATPase [Desulfovibrio sp.]
MLQSLSIKGFKCFDDKYFSLAPLTVLTGQNASGKTSFLHSLALLHQSICDNETLAILLLNGSVVNLG